jgi:hypothetical protein
MVEKEEVGGRSKRIPQLTFDAAARRKGSRVGS